MERLIFTSSNGDIIYFDGPPFYLSRVSGLGEVESEMQLQKSPYQDGSTLLGSVLQERKITIEFLIEHQSYADISNSRAKIARAFNPKLKPGILRYENDFTKREIEAIAESVPFYPDGSGNRGITLQKGMISLTCPNPYWKNVSVIEHTLTAWIGKFEFPFQFPVEFGERADRATIVNDGDEKTPVIIEFTGPATNPIVTNETTGERIRVNRVLGSGDVLEVNTAFGNKTVEIVSPDGTRTNVFNYIDLDSEFFQLVPGENEISFSSDDADNIGSVLIKYKNRYLGV